jgi:hypothetical protein
MGGVVFVNIIFSKATGVFSKNLGVFEKHSLMSFFTLFYIPLLFIITKYIRIE